MLPKQRRQWNLSSISRLSLMILWNYCRRKQGTKYMSENKRLCFTSKRKTRLFKKFQLSFKKLMKRLRKNIANLRTNSSLSKTLQKSRWRTLRTRINLWISNRNTQLKIKFKAKPPGLVHRIRGPLILNAHIYLAPPSKRNLKRKRLSKTSE